MKVSFVSLTLCPWGYGHCSFCSRLSILFGQNFGFIFFFPVSANYCCFGIQLKNVSVLFLNTFSFLINKCQQPGAYEQPYSNKRMYTAGSTQFAKEKQINISGFWGLFVNNSTFKNINLVVIALSVHSRLILWLIPLISWNGEVAMGSLFNIYKKWKPGNSQVDLTVYNSHFWDWNKVNTWVMVGDWTPTARPTTATKNLYQVLFLGTFAESTL